jgi:hypothetical protein
MLVASTDHRQNVFTRLEAKKAAAILQEYFHHPRKRVRL